MVYSSKISIDIQQLGGVSELLNVILSKLPCSSMETVLARGENIVTLPGMK
jgi:hypothetical protein